MRSWGYRKGIWILALVSVVTGACGEGTPTASTPRPSFRIPGVPTPASQTGGRVTELIDFVAGTEGRPGQINTYWAETFPSMFPNLPYESPTSVVSYRRGEIPESACVAPDDTAEEFFRNAFYCSADAGIDWELEFLAETFEDPGAWSAAAVIAHEWGHHIQRLSDTYSEHSIGIELQADCYAGLFTSYAVDQGVIDLEDARQGGRRLFQDGAEDGGLWFRPQVHGTPMERLLSHTLGWISGRANTCLGWRSYRRGEVVEIPPFELATPTGTDVVALQRRNTYRLSAASGVAADVGAWSWRDLPGEGSAQDRVNDVAANWFAGSRVEYPDRVTHVPLGDGTNIPLENFVHGRQTIFAVNYRQTADGASAVGVFALVVDPGLGGFVIDVYDDSTAGGSSEPILVFLLSLLGGVSES